MRPKNISLKMILLSILLPMFHLLFGQGLALEPSVAQPNGNENTCPVSIQVDGGGNVQATRSNGETINTRSAALQADCGELVQISAIPDRQWRFVRWLGVDAARQDLPTISVLSPANVTAVFALREVTTVPLEEPFYNRAGQLVSEISVMEPYWHSLAGTGVVRDQTSSPEFDIWYGDPQPFGQPGVAQNWLDILGNVSDSDLDLVDLSYGLNGGAPVEMSFGGDGSLVDGRRLYFPGDFVINLDVNDLNSGENNINIRAKDSLDNVTIVRVVVNYTPSVSGWPLPSNVDWDSIGVQPGDLLNVSQVVDGQWYITEDGGVRNRNMAYDRLLDVGDVDWTNYEALVPVTINDYSEAGFGPHQGQPSVGLIVHWHGHTDSPINCEQPECGWLPIGMANWYSWEDDGSGNARFSMWVHNVSSPEYDTSGLELEFGRTYLWRISVDNEEGPYGTYRLKVWPLGQPEPASWLMEVAGTDRSLDRGSLLILAHHTDITVGDIKLRQLNGDFDPPQISDVMVEVDGDQATVSWNTDEPASSRVDFYSDPGDVQAVEDGSAVESHSLVLENLEFDTTYTFTITSEDESLNVVTTDEDTFETEPVVYRLRVLSSGGGNVEVTPLQTEYRAGDNVSLEALPIPGFYLVNWTVRVGSGAPVTLDPVSPLEIEISGNTVVTATFDRIDVKFYIPMTIGQN